MKEGKKPPSQEELMRQKSSELDQKYKHKLDEYEQQKTKDEAQFKKFQDLVKSENESQEQKRQKLE